ncbi:hypothetical protein [uncultured Roseibium sp.]|uniref:hypothetical protein n=1 Tax=uncultured Roseibium sp. TaxID=1936171 RepID=UPI003217EBC1
MKNLAFPLAALGLSLAATNVLADDLSDVIGGWVVDSHTCEDYFEERIEIRMKISQTKISYWETFCDIRRTKRKGNEVDLILLCSSEGSEWEGREKLRVLEPDKIYRPEADTTYRRCE